jgi:hypothetical protein
VQRVRLLVFPESGSFVERLVHHVHCSALSARFPGQGADHGSGSLLFLPERRLMSAVAASSPRARIRAFGRGGFSHFRGENGSQGVESGSVCNTRTLCNGLHSSKITRCFLRALV